jgi:hypothetical protein
MALRLLTHKTDIELQRTTVRQFIQGDLVKPVTGGGIQRAVANTSDLVVGVFNGVFYTDPTTQKPTWKNYYPGTVNASDIVATIIDDPDVVYSIDSDGAFAVADIFKNFAINNRDRKHFIRYF